MSLLTEIAIVVGVMFTVLAIGLAWEWAFAWIGAAFDRRRTRHADPFMAVPDRVAPGAAHLRERDAVPPLPGVRLHDAWVDGRSAARLVGPSHVVRGRSMADALGRVKRPRPFLLDASADERRKA